ncbi:MAG: peptidoglycan DD-metalloendopeptidase family protein [Pseudomonadota bacterium]
MFFFKLMGMNPPFRGRFFPCGFYNCFKILGFLFYALGISLSMPSVLSLAAPKDTPQTKESQIRRIETDLSREKEQYRKFDSKEKNLLEQLADIEEEVTDKRRLLKELRGRIQQSRNELVTGEKSLSEQERVLREAEDRLSRRLVALYKYAKRGYIRILATAGGLDAVRKRMKYLGVIVYGDKLVLQEMAHEKRRYLEELGQIREKLDVIRNMEKSEADRLLSIKKDIEKKVILLATIHKEKEFYETAVKELQMAAQNLKETILNLERDPPKRKTLPSGFENAKGKLPLPFHGKIIKKDRRLRGEIVKTRKGIYIKGPLGAEIQAVFPGRIDFSGQLKGYGEIIVINHGSRFFTISAHLLKRNKEKGELVEEGEVIGLLGQSGSFMGPMLYFEIRRAEVNLNPLIWLKVH